MLSLQHEEECTKADPLTVYLTVPWKEHNVHTQTKFHPRKHFTLRGGNYVTERHFFLSMYSQCVSCNHGQETQNQRNINLLQGQGIREHLLAFSR